MFSELYENIPVGYHTKVIFERLMGEGGLQDNGLKLDTVLEYLHASVLYTSVQP